MIKVSTQKVPDKDLSEIWLVFTDGTKIGTHYGPNGYRLKNYVMEITLKRRRKRKTP
jgi:hypothetical protein